MKFAGIREARNKLFDLVDDDDQVLITRHGEPVAFLTPWKDRENLPIQVKRQAYINNTEKRRKLFGHIDEKEMLEDFEKFRRSGGRRRR